MYYLVKQWEQQDTNFKNNYDNDVKLRVEAVYHKLGKLYGNKDLVVRASKHDAVVLMNSDSLYDRILALKRILLEDPTVELISSDNDIAAELNQLEELIAEKYAKKKVEEELSERIENKINQKYSDYVREIKIEVLKEQSSNYENAQTLRKLGQLEKMEQVNLNRSALEILRPSTLGEIVGQEKAIKSLLAKLNTPYPQHILLYGPPGVGKTTCARLALEMIKGRKENSFEKNAPFIEVDGTTLRWDPRESTNPLLGSVHDPIYQGAKKELAEDGIPEPKLGLASEAHGGILFIDEIGEMDPVLQNKLLKVLEDKRIYFESSYYDPHDKKIPQYIKQIFEKGVPADFVLIGATTRSREDINPAFRSRCMEVFFEPLSAENIKQIVKLSAQKLRIDIDDKIEEIIADYTNEGRSANKILVDAYALAINEDCTHRNRIKVQPRHIYEAIQNSRINPQVRCRASGNAETGKIFGVGASGFSGSLIEIECIAFAAEKKGEGTIRFNETAGSMTRDSVFNAASVLRKETGENIKNYDLHINIVGGGRVDGPSAGAAIYLAILSAIKQKPLLQDIAITGELSLQGRLKPVGALYEKIYAAKEAGIKKILVPQANFKDIPESINSIRIVPVNYVAETYEHFFSVDSK